MRSAKHPIPRNVKKIAPFLLLMVGLLSSGSSQADAEFQNIAKAKRYVSIERLRQGLPESTWMEVEDAAPHAKRIKFNISTEINEHWCQVTGEASRLSPSLIVFKDGECELHISTKGRYATLLDIDGKCKPKYCGFNAGLHDFQFVEKSRTNSESQNDRRKP